MKPVNKLSRLIVLVVGVGIATAGIYQLTPVQAETLPASFEWKTPLIDTQGVLFAGKERVSNLAPGDSLGGTLVITNNGEQNKWVQLRNQLQGGGNGHPDIFADYPHSIDASIGEPSDNNPATLNYTISTSGLLGTAQPIQVGPFSVSEESPPFLLRPGQSATIRYALNFPMAAHNDYQGATGTIRVNVVFSHNIDGTGGVEGGTISS